MHVLLNTDGFLKDAAVEFTDDWSRLAFRLENRSGLVHDGSFEVSGLPDEDYAVLLNGRQIHSFTTSAGLAVLCPYRLSEAPEHMVRIERTGVDVPAEVRHP